MERTKSIFIDAGHGGVDCGCPYGKKEKYYNLQVATELFKELYKRGYYPMLSRNYDRSLSLKERCQTANAFYTKRKGIFVSIHHNAAENTSASGLEVFHLGKSKAGKKLASQFDNAYKFHLHEWNQRYRGIKEANYYVLVHTQAPAILVECDFLSNKDVLERIAEDEMGWFRHMALIIADAVELYYRQ